MQAKWKKMEKKSNKFFHPCYIVQSDSPTVAIVFCQPNLLSKYQNSLCIWFEMWILNSGPFSLSLSGVFFGVPAIQRAQWPFQWLIKSESSVPVFCQETAEKATLWANFAWFIRNQSKFTLYGPLLIGSQGPEWTSQNGMIFLKTNLRAITNLHSRSSVSSVL